MYMNLQLPQYIVTPIPRLWLQCCLKHSQSQTLEDKERLLRELGRTRQSGLWKAGRLANASRTTAGIRTRSGSNPDCVRVIPAARRAAERRAAAPSNRATNPVASADTADSRSGRSGCPDPDTIFGLFILLSFF